MSLHLGTKKIETVILDFDETMYPDNDVELEERMWGEIKNNLIIELLASQGKKDPTKQLFEQTKAKYLELGPKIGWTKAYYSIGGEPTTFTRIARSNPKAKHLKPDILLQKILRAMKKYVRIFVFTGSTHQSAEEAIAVLLSGRHSELTEAIVADDDLPEGVEKPNRDAYKTLLAVYTINPKTAVMVDDQVSEIETALSLGMQGVLVGKRHAAEIRKRMPYHIETVHKLGELLVS